MIMTPKQRTNSKSSSSGANWIEFKQTPTDSLIPTHAHMAVSKLDATDSCILSIAEYLLKCISKQVTIIAVTIVCMVQPIHATICGVVLSSDSAWRLLLETGTLNGQTYYSRWGGTSMLYYRSESGWLLGSTLDSTSASLRCVSDDLLTCTSGTWYYWDGSMDTSATISRWECPTQQPTDPHILVVQPKTWDEAESYCQSTYNSHLATITDDLSAQALLDLHLDLCPHCGELWMGLNDYASEGVWEYVDGTECHTYGCGSSYKYWNDGEPTDTSGKEDCAYIRSPLGLSINNMLNDGTCTALYTFACNRPTSNPTNNPTSTPTVIPT
eukprot:149296_1